MLFDKVDLHLFKQSRTHEMREKRTRKVDSNNVLQFGPTESFPIIFLFRSYVFLASWMFMWSGGFTVRTTHDSNMSNRGENENTSTALHLIAPCLSSRCGSGSNKYLDRNLHTHRNKMNPINVCYSCSQNLSDRNLYFYEFAILPFVYLMSRSHYAIQLNVYKSTVVAKRSAGEIFLLSF